MITLQSIFDRIEPYISNITDLTVIFIAIFLSAWFCNGYFGFKFELSALQSFYLCIAGIKTANYGINSAFNTARGSSKEIPVKKEE